MTVTNPKASRKTMSHNVEWRRSVATSNEILKNTKLCTVLHAIIRKRLLIIPSCLRFNRVKAFQNTHP